ncbi:serine hydrolase [Devosia sp. ZB163]|uniref:serine hydrolase domain-containing protein n=1 Tax=Devosia sp. ZB163 TaxID=3025938 RepID=UPI00235EEB80|nr:serine hydrolase domain-containing protein [Devosia sp. ZB163]MDC9825633.1 serine hydrolase [Devosia sp. ZB163]
MSATDADALITQAGLATTQPIAIAARGRRGRVSAVTGYWPDGGPVQAGDLFYAASLTKQVTGAIIARLVQSGSIDPDFPVPQNFLPRWTVLPTVRQVLHHTASLPEAGRLENALDGGSWTSEYVMQMAAELAPPDCPIGSAFAYSNLGYVMLARLAEQVAGRTFAELAADVLPSSAASGMAFFATGALPVSPHAALLGSSLPLTTGDGGLWTTADAYADFLDMQNEDRSGAARLTQADHRLRNGEFVRYGWGIGIRTLAGHPLYIHGGGWTGARCKAIRSPALGLSVVVLTVGEQDAAISALVDKLAEAVA